MTTTTTDKRTVWQLARLAACADPDSIESPGAEFLRSVETTVAEYREYDSTKDVDASDLAHEIADGAVPIYTHNLWQTFVDLAAYNEDVSEYGFEYDADRPEQYPSLALYMIASRLASALLDEMTDEEDDNDA